MSLAEVALGSRSASAEALTKTKVRNHQLNSRVVFTSGMIGLPQAVHEITVTKGTRTRTIRGLGFFQKPRT